MPVARYAAVPSNMRPDSRSEAVHSFDRDAEPGQGARGIVGRISWLLRMLIVGVLILDFVTVPLHRHSHDGDVPYSELEMVEMVTHAEEWLNVPSHAIGAIRANFFKPGRLPPPSDDHWIGSVALAEVLLPAVWPEQAFPAVAQAPPPRPQFRSLPPAGRAPPLAA